MPIQNLPGGLNLTNLSPGTALLSPQPGQRFGWHKGVRHNRVDDCGKISWTLRRLVFASEIYPPGDLPGQSEQFQKIDEPQHASSRRHFPKWVSWRNTCPARG